MPPSEHSRVAVLVVSGRILAALKIPAGLEMWDVFATRCTFVAGAEAQVIDLEDALKDLPGVKFVRVEEFLSKVAAEVSPQC